MLKLLKKYLEDKQRKRRKDGESVKPVWFTFNDKVRHQPEKSITDTQLLPKWTYTNEYFSSKAKGFDATCESRGNSLFAFSATENFSDASSAKDSKSQMALNVANLDSTIETQSKKEISEYLKNEREKLKT